MHLSATMNVLKVLTVLGYSKFGCYVLLCWTLSFISFFISIFRNWICLSYHKYSSYAAGFHRKSWAVVELAQVRPKFTTDLPVNGIRLFAHDLLLFSSIGVSTSHQTVNTLISNFRHVLNVVCFLLDDSLVSEFYRLTNADAGELPRRKHTTLLAPVYQTALSYIPASHHCDMCMSLQQNWHFTSVQVYVCFHFSLQM